MTEEEPATAVLLCLINYVVMAINYKQLCVLTDGLGTRLHGDCQLDVSRGRHCFCVSSVLAGCRSTVLSCLRGKSVDNGVLVTACGSSFVRSELTTA